MIRLTVMHFETKGYSRWNYWMNCLPRTTNSQKCSETSRSIRCCLTNSQMTQNLRPRMTRCFPRTDCSCLTATIRYCFRWTMTYCSTNSGTTHCSLTTGCCNWIRCSENSNWTTIRLNRSNDFFRLMSNCCYPNLTNWPSFRNCFGSTRCWLNSTTNQNSWNHLTNSTENFRLTMTIHCSN